MTWLKVDDPEYRAAVLARAAFDVRWNGKRLTPEAVIELGELDAAVERSVANWPAPLSDMQPT